MAIIVESLALYETRIDRSRFARSADAVRTGGFPGGRHAVDLSWRREPVRRRLKRIPKVQEVYFVTGEWDYLVKVRVRNKEEYYETMKRVAKIFGVRAKGMICPREVKSTDAIPFTPLGLG